MHISHRKRRGKSEQFHPAVLHERERGEDAQDAQQPRRAAGQPLAEIFHVILLDWNCAGYVDTDF